MPRILQQKQPEQQREIVQVDLYLFVVVHIYYFIIWYVVHIEEDEGNVDAQIQTASKATLSVSTVPNGIEPIPLSLSLSSFFTKAQTMGPESRLAELLVPDQPKEHRKRHTLHCLQNGECPLISGKSASQRHGLDIKVRVQINYLIILIIFL